MKSPLSKLFCGPLVGNKVCVPRFCEGRELPGKRASGGGSFCRDHRVAGGAQQHRAGCLDGTGPGGDGDLLQARPH